MFVACSTLCFAKHPLDRALRLMGELEFSKVDVAIREQGPHLKPSEVMADVSAAAHQIRIGPSLAAAAFSVEIDCPNDADYAKQLQAICRLARTCSVAVIAIPASPVAFGQEREARRLGDLVKLASTEGAVLTVETRAGTLTETPEGAVELCERVPGLGLTLDPSHFIAGPHQGKNFDQVFPFVYHVHLRDTGRGPNQFQVRVGQGEVEYGRIINQLARYQYERALTVQIHDVPDAPFIMEQEVRKLKYLLESLV
ncbi:xylose isomerase [Planctomycetaceae bacterium SCGC AG-212-D15]|nr:xylose isomerase [Planctomycetaceae bacterium SCGC AG-212-D15]